MRRRRTAEGGAATTPDEAAIRSVIAATTEMFNRHDAKGFVPYYAPDADLVTVRGEVSMLPSDSSVPTSCWRMSPMS